jgi:Rrf2 family protein
LYFTIALVKSILRFYNKVIEHFMQGNAGMLITKASEYALLALIVIAKEKEPINTDVLSSQLDISRSFLAKILQILAKHNILISYKGAKGGFSLSCKPSELSILVVMKIVEDNKPLVFECSTDDKPCMKFSGEKKCAVWGVLKNLQLKIEDFLSDISLEDILK